MRTVSWKNGKLVLIDQTRLPFDFSLIETSDINRIATAIRKLKVRGAPAIGVTAAYAMAIAAMQAQDQSPGVLEANLTNAYNLLSSTRPTSHKSFLGS